MHLYEFKRTGVIPGSFKFLLPFLIDRLYALFSDIKCLILVFGFYLLRHTVILVQIFPALDTLFFLVIQFITPDYSMCQCEAFMYNFLPMCASYKKTRRLCHEIR